MRATPIHLPKTVGEWTRNEMTQRVDSTNIFEYMDGAGELYLGYRFHHLEVYEYNTKDSLNSILVELYFMNSSDDAFGLLSLDWGGEPIDFDQAAENDSISTIALPTRALYGGGLLRIWSDDLYVRIMAYTETPESKQAILNLGQAISSQRHQSPQPHLLRVLPAEFDSGWKLRRDRIGYFRSYLVLNSLYYLSHRNILELAYSTEAVTAPYEKISEQPNSQRIQVLFIKYADELKAQKALKHFIADYLPEHQAQKTQTIKLEIECFFKIEDGWLGYKFQGRCLAIVFQCPDNKCAQNIIAQMESISKMDSI